MNGLQISSSMTLIRCVSAEKRAIVGGLNLLGTGGIIKKSAEGNQTVVLAQHVQGCVKKTTTTTGTNAPFQELRVTMWNMFFWHGE